MASKRRAMQALVERPKTLSQFLEHLERDDPYVANARPLATYARAFQGFPYSAVGFLGMGAEAMAVELAGQRVLKIYDHGLPYGTRSFDPRIDVPILDQGVAHDMSTEPPTPVYYVIQPKVDVKNVRPQDRSLFEDAISRLGYQFRRIEVEGHIHSENGRGQIGKLENRLLLVDPLAVVKA